MVISLSQDKDYNSAATFKYAHSNIYIDMCVCVCVYFKWQIWLHIVHIADIITEFVK